MFNLHLSAEQLEIRDTVRDFVARKITPVATRPARLEPRAKPLLMDALEQAAQMGLRTLALSEDAGGAGADTLTGCIVIEELAAGDADIAAVLARTSALARLMFGQWTNAEQRGRFLPDFVADDRYHIAHAGHEAAGGSLGSNYHRPEHSEAPLPVTATRSGNEFVLNGRHDGVANAPLAKLFAVEVADETTRLHTLLVPRDTPGLSVQDNDQPGRWYHGARGDITFDNCRVPATDLLAGVTADGAADNPLDQAIALGIGRAAYEAALDYAGLRVQGGRRIIEHQAIGTKLAGIAIRLDVARTAIWRAAWAADHPEAVADGSLPNLPLASVAKVFSSEAIYHATKDAAECFGAMGVMRDMPLQKFIHDALVCLHSGVSNSDAKLRIAELLAGYARPVVLSAAE
jgi:alkylation response protein AidB-like acyl-CoA dehydrogenase